MSDDDQEDAYIAYLDMLRTHPNPSAFFRGTLIATVFTVKAKMGIPLERFLRDIEIVWKHVEIAEALVDAKEETDKDLN